MRKAKCPGITSCTRWLSLSLGVRMLVAVWLEAVGLWVGGSELSCNGDLLVPGPLTTPRDCSFVTNHGDLRTHLTPASFLDLF